MKQSSTENVMGLKTSGGLPEKRLEGIVIEQVASETLLYDEAKHKAYCLNATAAAVWSACDGVRTVPQIAATVTATLAHPVDEDLVLFTLNELRRDGLIKAESVSVDLPSPSRRLMLQKLGASAVLLLPAIALIAAPKAAHAISGVVTNSRNPLFRLDY
jgi:hypothetical protein